MGDFYFLKFTIMKTIFLKSLLVLSYLVYNLSLSAQINPINNKIGIDLSTMPQSTQTFNYDSCFKIGTDLGMNQIGLFQNWTAVETSPNVFNMTVFDIANIYYPYYNMPVDLTITPIHTNNLEVPNDLISIPFDNSVFIHRFKILLDSIKIHTPNITYSSIIIGSEHDIYLGNDTNKWNQFNVFYDSIAIYAKSLWNNVNIATELTFGGLVTHNTKAQKLNLNSNYIGVSYYPLNSDFTVRPINTIDNDFATLVNLYPNKPICFYQYGYPSSNICNSSEEQQAQFITQTFNSWDTYAENIKLIDFTWLHDLDTSVVNQFSSYYGVSDTAFLEFLRTIGLRTFENKGTDKLALNELRCQLKERNYNSLNLNCSVKISDINPLEKATIYPMPTKNILTIENLHEFKNAEIQIIDNLGNKVKSISNKFGKIINIDLNGIKSGFYTINIKDGNCFVNKKIIINN